ncbi:MAG TPA: ABC transporter permease [Steroidobacter sp.]|uniref:ABC transporter permease n=1 Tax=Steroidobacter sp. TaxID=1978227 RepID=UPI002ED78B8B
MLYVRLIAARIPALLLVLLGVSAVTFVISHIVPADVARMVAGDYASDEAVAAIRAQLGLDQPLWRQYLIYVRDLLSGDFGTSIRTGQPVLKDLLTYFPATVELALAALLLALALGVPLGVAAAVSQGRWIDRAVRLFAAISVSTPSFWLGLMLISVFYGRLDLFPAGGRMSEEFLDVDHVTGLHVVDAFLSGRAGAVADALWRLALPAFSLALVAMGGFARMIRSSMRETLQEDYVRVARSLGLPERRVVLAHALPNALIPFVTMLGLSLANLLTGAVVTEAVFMWPGIGSYILESTLAVDFPAIMGFTALVSFIYVAANLAVDLLYLRLDPRQRKVGA